MLLFPPLTVVNAAGEINPGKVEVGSGFGAAGIGGVTQVGGLIGDCKNKSGVSGYNTGGLIGTPFGTGDGGKDPAM